MPCALAAAALAALLAGCSRKSGPPEIPPLGKPVALGNASDLRISPDGRFAAYLLDARKPNLEGLPPQVQLGELWLVPLEGGEPVRVGEGVVSTPGAYVFSPSSRWLAFLARYNVAEQQGELRVLDLQKPAEEPRRLGGAVSYVLPSPDSKYVAFVDDGKLGVAPFEGGAPATVASDVSSATFAPDGSFLLVQQRAVSGEGLLFVPAGKWDQKRKLADAVGDVAVSPDAKHLAFSQRSSKLPGTFDLLHANVADLAVKAIAQGVTTGAPFAGASFAFSPDSKYLARTEGGRPEKRGALFVGPATGEPGRKLAENVYHFEFAPDSSALAFLYDYSDNRGPGQGHGKMGVAALPDGARKALGERVPNFEWGADGRYVAFVSRFFKPIYSVDL